MTAFQTKALVNILQFVENKMLGLVNDCKITSTTIMIRVLLFRISTKKNHMCPNYYIRYFPDYTLGNSFHIVDSASVIDIRGSTLTGCRGYTFLSFSVIITPVEQRIGDTLCVGSSIP